MNWNSMTGSLKKTSRAFIRGELLWRLGCDKLFPYIVYTFMLFWILILLNIMVENTLGKVDKNRETLGALKIAHTEKAVELAEIGRITRAESLLKEMGSDVTFPSEPATRIDAKEK